MTCSTRRDVGGYILSPYPTYAQGPASPSRAAGFLRSVGLSIPRQSFLSPRRGRLTGQPRGRPCKLMQRAA